MSYKALLFCPDEKTARVVTQVLSELEFQVDPCNEPFAAVKKLTSEHFDAIVVDCDNEQNAGLLFKSGKGSGLNQQSLSVAVVEGQIGVAKAFRLGANLVLTKPINVEQSKGTLRVARGLLRKNEGSKTALTPSVAPVAPPPVQERPAAPPPVAVMAPPPAPTHEIPPVKAPVFAPPTIAAAPSPAATIFEVENEPEVKPDSTEAAFLESMQDPLAGTKLAGDSSDSSKKESPWQQVAKAAAAAETTQATPSATDILAPAKPVEPASRPLATSSGFGQGAAAAPAPAKEPVPSIADEPKRVEVEPPTFGSLGGKPAKHETDDSGGGSKKGLVIAAVVLLAAAAGYFGWTKLHSANQVSTPPAPAPSAPASNVSPAVQVPSSVTPAPAQSSAAVSPTSQPVVSTRAAETQPSPSPATKSDSEAAAESAPPKNTPAAKPATETLVVKSESSIKPPAPAPVPAETVQPPSASALTPTSDSSAKAISGIMSSPTATASQPVSSLKISQGVAQGLQIKRVQPVYPAQARQARLQGAVELLATISKDGNITSLKQLGGDKVLGHAAMDAVKQWKYRPYLLDGQPVEIQTNITVNFTLP